MGLFKSAKDLGKLTKQAKELQNQKQQEAGYKPGMRGQLAQMGDMIGQATEQVSELTDESGDRARILAEGLPGQGVIVAHGTPERGAQWFNLDIDLEVHVSGRQAYRVNNQYMVPATATLGAGVTLPIKVDPNDPAKIAIDWDSAEKPPAPGEIRSVAPPGPASTTAGPVEPVLDAPVVATDTVAELERLAKLRDSGALTDSEFEQQKAKILGS